MAKIIVLCGLPLSGKTTIARIVGKILGIPVLDRDDIFRFLFGSSGKVESTIGGMYQFKTSVCHYLLMLIALVQLLRGKDLIIVGVFTRPKRQKDLGRLYDLVPGTVKIIACYLGCKDEREILRRLALRNQDSDHPGGLHDIKEYWKIAEAAQPLPMRAYSLDTKAPNTAEKCAWKVIKYLGR